MLKKILIAVLLWPLLALAQSYPSPTFQNVTVLGTTTEGSVAITGGSISGISPPIPVASGGTNSASASGTALDNIAGFSGTGFISRTGAGAYSFTASTGSGSVVLGTSPSISGASITGGTISGLSSPVPIGSGGTGAATLAQYATILGNGTSALQTASPGVAGTALLSNGTSANPSFQNIPWTSPVVANVLQYGAVGNSNGTHGNGTDNTSAFQSALTAAVSANIPVFIPCGTYRLTGNVLSTAASPVGIYGQGACSRIFSDQSSAGATFTFSPSTGTCGAQNNQPCVVARGLAFLTPNVVGSGQMAFSLTNMNSPYFDDIEFIGQQIGVSLTTSYSPRFHNVRVYGGATGFYSVDTSFNSGDVFASSIYNTTSQGILIEPASGCVTNVSIRGNDLEGNASSVAFGGICSGSFVDNYEENATTQVPFTFLGTNSSIFFSGNTINPATNGGTGSWSISHLTNSTFTNNNISASNITYGASVSKVRLRASENTLSSVTLPATTVACTGLGTGGTCSIGSGDDYAGYVSMTTGTSPASTGQVTLTFTNALGPNHAHCNWTPINDTANWGAPFTMIGNSAATTSTIGLWTNGAALTGSQTYFMGYQCGGY
jgi:hypothetical protein